MCGRAETTKHYLFVYSRFNDLRYKMMQEISPLYKPTLDTLLYGNRELSDESNKHILLVYRNNNIDTEIQINCLHRCHLVLFLTLI